LLNAPITRTEANKSENASDISVGMCKSTAKKADRSRRDMRRSNRHAYLVVDGQSQGFHCALREFSDTGAFLTISGLMGIPERFSLFVEPDSIKFDCVVSQLKGNSVRVAFTGRTENSRYRELKSRQ
jgi:hypothetical protein